MKGQTAMEYLMTYGWAIVVIVIVLGLLALMFSQTQTMERCTVSPTGTFSCDYHVAYKQGNDVHANATLTNLQDAGVHISKVACTVGKTEPTAYDSVNKDVGAGDSISLDAICKDAGNMNVGDRFSGMLWVKYCLSNEYSGSSCSIERTAKVAIGTTVASK